jgi:hypothetical protein
MLTWNLCKCSLVFWDSLLCLVTSTSVHAEVHAEVHAGCMPCKVSGAHNLQLAHVCTGVDKVSIAGLTQHRSAQLSTGGTGDIQQPGNSKEALNSNQFLGQKQLLRLD